MPFGIGKKEKDEDDGQIAVAEKQESEIAADEETQFPVATNGAEPANVVQTVGGDSEGVASADGAAAEQPEIGVGKETQEDEAEENDDDLLGDIFDEEETSNEALQTLAAGLPEVDVHELVTLTNEVASHLGIAVPA